MINQNRYILTENNQLDVLLKKIGEKFLVVEGKCAKRNLGYYDTFDWRLYLQGILLLKEHKGYSIMSLDERTTFASLHWPKKTHLKFWWDYPDNSLKTKLKTIIEVRALLPTAIITKEVKTYKINTSARKNVALLSVEDFRFNDKEDPFIKLLILNPARNVLSEYLELQGILRSCSIKVVDDVYIRCLNASGKTAGDYKSKIEISIDPQMHSAEAAKKILRCLFDVLLKNEEGIKKKIDIEFLHDYRVAVRRTRTILGQIKGIFSPVVISGLKNEFSKLAKLSNEARDLDVYLQRKKEFEAMLPEHFAGSLDPLFDHLKRKGKKEQSRLIRWLNSQSYEEFKKSYMAFLNDNSEGFTNVENSNVPIGKLATDAILLKYGQVIEYGTKITKNTPDEDLHRLRIECKKLRYLLELFAGIYAPKRVEFLISQLKKLQTNLGDFNDMFVQQESLRNYLDTIPNMQRESIKTASAVGGLITQLYIERKKVRRAFKKTFEMFHKSSVKKISKSLIYS